MRFLAAAALLSIAACSDARVAVTLPELSGARTVFLAAEHGGVVQAWVFDLAQSTPLEMPPLFRDDAELSLALAAYPDAPERFGVMAGPLATETGRNPLSAEGATIFSTFVEDSFVGWNAIDVLPLSLRSLRVPGGASPCARFLPRPFGGLGAISAGGVLVPLDADSALGSLRSGQFFRITRDGVTPLGLPRTLPAATGYAARDGTLWLFGAAGSVASGGLPGGFTAHPAAPTADELVALTEVPGSTRAIDLFVLSGVGELFRYDGDNWRRLSDAQTEMTPSRAVGAAAVDDVLFSSGTALLHHWDGDRVRDVLAVDEDVREVEGLSYVPGLGYVFGTTFDGRFYLRDADAQTTRLLGSEGQPRTLGLSVDGIIPFEGGFFATGGLGATLQYVPGYGFCPAATPVAANAVTRALIMGRDIVLLTETDDGIAPTAVWLLRQ